MIHSDSVRAWETETAALRAEIARLKADDVQHRIRWEELKDARAEVARLKDRIDEHHRMFEPMRAGVERLRIQRDEARRREREWHNASAIDRADCERLRTRVNDQNADYKKLEEDNASCLRTITELRFENERLKRALVNRDNE